MKKLVLVLVPWGSKTASRIVLNAKTQEEQVRYLRVLLVALLDMAVFRVFIRLTDEKMLKIEKLPSSDKVSPELWGLVRVRLDKDILHQGVLATAAVEVALEALALS